MEQSWRLRRSYCYHRSRCRGDIPDLDRSKSVDDIPNRDCLICKYDLHVVVNPEPFSNQFAINLGVKVTLADAWLQQMDRKFEGVRTVETVDVTDRARKRKTPAAKAGVLQSIQFGDLEEAAAEITTET
jgi:hypothetical protein